MPANMKFMFKYRQRLPQSIIQTKTRILDLWNSALRNFASRKAFLGLVLALVCIPSSSALISAIGLPPRLEHFSFRLLASTIGEYTVNRHKNERFASLER